MSLFPRVLAALALTTVLTTSTLAWAEPAPAPALCAINQCPGVPSLLRAALVDRGALTAQASTIRVGADGRASLHTIVTSPDDVARLKAAAAASRTAIEVAPLRLRAGLVYQVVVPIAVASSALVITPPSTTTGSVDMFLEIEGVKGESTPSGSGTPPPDDTEGGSSDGGEAEPVCVTVMGIEMCV